MTFQFLCPQGHLLQGEEAHMGMQCQCPQCGTAFIIPTIDRPQSPATVSGGAATADDLDLAPIDEPDPINDFFSQPPPSETAPPSSPPASQRRSPASGAPTSSQSAPPPTREPSEGGFSGHALDDDSDGLDDELGETLLHIPCPNGHVLDVPLDMIGARAMCPHCRAEFRLRREKSEEYLREQEILDAKRAQFWFKLAIIAAGVVVVVLLVMILATALT